MLNLYDSLLDKKKSNIIRNSSSTKKHCYSESKNRQLTWKSSKHMNSVSVCQPDFGNLNLNESLPNFNIFSLSKRDNEVYKESINNKKSFTARKENNNLRRKILNKVKRGSQLNDRTIQLDCDLELCRREKGGIAAMAHKKSVIIPARTIALS